MHARSQFRGLTPGLLALVVLLAPAAPSHAWPTDPGLNLPVMTAGSVVTSPHVVADGAGGAFVTWSEARTGGAGWDIYAHHLLASGILDPLWPAQGLAVCTASGHQAWARVVADGTGQAIVVWQDQRSGTWDIYAQRVFSNGAVDGVWPANGRAICTAADDQYEPRHVSDGFGGAIITWGDKRTGHLTDDVYAQRVLVSGVVDPAWPANGRALCTAPSGQGLSRIVEDDAGGAIVAWSDNRSPLGSAVYATRVLGSGVVDPAWPSDGRLIGAKGADWTSRRTDRAAR